MNEQATGTLTFRIASDEDGNAIRDFLERASLPTESIGKNSTDFYVAELDGSVAAVAGLEYYGSDALLRSVAVRPELRNRGLGNQIVDFMLSTARGQKSTRVVLLTETAERFFAKKGFTVVDRTSLKNDALSHSSEFAHACPKSAVCMVLNLF